MNNQAESRVSTENSLAPEQVADYLHQHPDFFDQHPALLAALDIAHAPEGAVSLVERQVRTLRERNRVLESQLSELLQVARENETLVVRLHQLGLRLLGSQPLPQTLEKVYASLRDGYDAEAVTLLLFDAARAGEREGPAYYVDPDAPAHSSWLSKLMANGRPRCGEFDAAWLEQLFGDSAGKIASSALVPLLAPEPVGLLAIGSHQRERFTPAMGTDFLARIGELVGTAVYVRRQQGQ